MHPTVVIAVRIESLSLIEIIWMDAKMNDIPDLPFEKILGYLSLDDRIRSRA